MLKTSREVLKILPSAKKLLYSISNSLPKNILVITQDYQVEVILYLMSFLVITLSLKLKFQALYIYSKKILLFKQAIYKLINIIKFVYDKLKNFFFVYLLAMGFEPAMFNSESFKCSHQYCGAIRKLKHLIALMLQYCNHYQIFYYFVKPYIVKKRKKQFKL